MSMLADRVDYVIGIDCHKDRHVAAVADRLGGLQATLECAQRRRWLPQLAGASRHIPHFVGK
jgi:hypothetical protein